MLQPGEVVGAYRIGRYLGEGPFGVVWQATASNGAPVALKLLKPGFIERPDGQAAFARLVNSVRLHAQVNHPNLARVYGAIQEPSRQLYGIVVEYCGGQLLSEVQLPPPPNPGGDPQAFLGGLLWFEELAGAVGWLHDQGIVHGNMKLRNVMLVRDPRAGGRVTPKLMDLSWASIGVAPPVPGTISFLSPEQIQATPPTAASDQYSLAAMLNHMLTQGHAGGQNLPAVLVMTIQRALSSMPYQRFRHISELASGIRALRAEFGQKQTHPAPTFAPLASSMDAGHGSSLTAPRNPLAGHATPRAQSQSAPSSAHRAQSSSVAGPGRMRIPKGSTVPMQSAAQSTRSGPRGGLGDASPVGFHDDPPTQRTTRDQVEPPTARFPNPMLPQTATSNGGFPPASLSPEQALFKEEGFADRDSPSSDFPLVPQARPLIPREDTDAANVAHPVVPKPASSGATRSDGPTLASDEGGMAFDPNVVGAMPEGPSMGFDQVDIEEQGPGIEQAPARAQESAPAVETPNMALVPHQESALVASGEAAPWSGLKTNMELPEESIADGASQGSAGVGIGRSKLFALGFLLLVLALGILGGAWTVLNSEKPDPTALNQTPPPEKTVEPPTTPTEVIPNPDAIEKPKTKPEAIAPTPKKDPVKAPKTKPPKKVAQTSKREKPRKTPEKSPEDQDIERAMAKLKPSKTEPDALMVACDEGNGSSCFKAARKLRTVKAPNEKVRETFERACRFNYAGGCVAAAKLWRQVDSAEAKRKALDLYQTACDRNLGSGCALAASMWAEGFGVVKDQAKADALDAKACKLGQKSSCHEPKAPPPKPEEKPEVKPAPEAKPEPAEKPEPEAKPEPKPAPKVAPKPEAKPEVKPDPKPEPEDDLKPAYTKPTKTSTGA